jgi:hypothetical protein
MSDEHLQDHFNKKKEEKEWLKVLTDVNSKTEFLHKLCDIKQDDHSHVKFIKDKINDLLHNELELLGFKNKLNEEEQASLNA